MDKFVLILLSFCALIQCRPHDPKTMEVIGKICRKESGMTEEPIAKALGHETLPPPSATYLKFMECSYKRQGYLDEDENIVYDEFKVMLREYYIESLIDTVIEPCKIQNETGSAGEKAYRVAMCIINGLHAKEQTEDDEINNEIKDD